MEKNLNEKLRILKSDSLFAHKEIKEIYENSAEYRWKNKKVLKELVIYNGENIDNVVTNNVIDKSIDNEFFLTGKSSLKVVIDNVVNGKKKRTYPSIVINIPKVDLSEYNRVLVNIYGKNDGLHNYYIHFNVSSPIDERSNAYSIKANEWNQVIWEIDDMKRYYCERIKIGPWIIGCPSEASEYSEIYIDSVLLQKVEADYVFGFDLNDRIAFSHAGYFPNSEKIALTGKDFKCDEHFYIFKVDDEKIDKEEIILKERIKEDGNFILMDFSSIKEEGAYYLSYNNKKTGIFYISDLCYDESIWKSMNFLRMLRCGEDVEGVHSACHLHSKTVDDEGRSVPNFGGWHDAGDVSQFEIPTAEMAHAICDLAHFYKHKDRDLYERLKEEAKVGLSWLLRTRFKNGYRALSILYSVWRDNLLDSDDDYINKNKAENGPFENFLASAACARGYELFIDSDASFARWCLKVAKSDFDFGKIGYDEGIYTKRWGPSVESQTLGHGLLASSILYNITGENYYLTISREYARKVMNCMEKDGVGKKKIRGFFYEDENHSYVVSYEHRGHENSCLLGLIELANIEKNKEDGIYNDLLIALNLYKEFIIDSIKYTYPYYLLPGNVYIRGKINLNRFTIPYLISDNSEANKKRAMDEIYKQMEGGINLGDDVYLRIFPIAPSRRGFHATLLAKTKAVSALALFLNDEELKKIAIYQLEWVLGRNPFASSTMYGFGYNYHPLYVAFSNQIVGSLPVGIMTQGDNDLPYYPTRDNAVYKEIWGHTTGKFLWILADVLKMR